LCCVSVVAILCFSLTSLRPIHALNNQSPGESAAQIEHGGRLPGSANLAGHWILQTTGDTVDIDDSNGKLTATIGGIDWELVPAGQGLGATKTLTPDDARRLFPDIGDAPALLGGKNINLLLTVAPGGASFEISMSMAVQRPGRRGSRDVSLMSGSLSRQPVDPDVFGAGSTRTANSEIVAQVVGPPTMSVFPSPAPNAFGSPSFGGYTTNAISALGSGVPTVGNPALTPTVCQRWAILRSLPQPTSE
jgi:hypothetical protein